jgi:hypothetical protein
MREREGREKEKRERGRAKREREKGERDEVHMTPQRVYVCTLMTFGIFGTDTVVVDGLYTREESERERNMINNAQ